MKIIAEFSPSFNEIEFLEKKLFQHNCKRIENYSYEQFIIKAVDGSNSIVAGIHCQIGGNWLYIESLWIEKEYRSQGLGKELLSRAEKIALKKSALVFTFTHIASKILDSIKSSGTISLVHLKISVMRTQNYI